MSKNKRPHQNTLDLRLLVEIHGVDKVLAATGYKLSSLNQYLNKGGPIIPDTRLNIAKQVLASKS